MRAKKPENWLARIAEAGHGIELEDALDPATQRTEALLMGLRLEEGVPLARIEGAYNRGEVERLAGHGLIALEPDRLRVLPAGMLVLDGVLREIAV